MIAVIKTGGKQYAVKEGDILTIEKIEGSVDEEISLGSPLLIASDDETQVEIGTPVLADKTVQARIMEQGRGKKVTIIKYKPKVRYRRKGGHRQPFTKVQIIKI